MKKEEIKTILELLKTRISKIETNFEDSEEREIRQAEVNMLIVYFQSKQIDNLTSQVNEL